VKNIFKIFVKRTQVKQTNQAILLEFVNDTKNINKAAKGSMDKRNELIERVLSSQPA